MLTRFIIRSWQINFNLSTSDTHWQDYFAKLLYSKTRIALLGLVDIDHGGSKYSQYRHVLGEKVSAALMIHANVSGIRLVVVAAYLRHIVLPLVVTVACELWLWLFTQSRLTVNIWETASVGKSPISSLHSMIFAETWNSKAMHTTFFIIVDEMICCEQIKRVKAMPMNDPSKSCVTSITIDYVNSSENNLWTSVVSTV